MSTPTRAFVGRLTELNVFDPLGDQVGRVRDVVARLAGGLAFLADLRLRSSEYGAALDLMRKAEQLSGSSAPVIRQRGERLAEALSRVGSEKLFYALTERLLSGDDQSSIEAAEILKRGGGRSATYLIERLAEEENRAHRARLVTLLKEMGKGTSGPFLARLEDPRWFLVRNVVGILGDIGDVSVLPRLRGVFAHSDPRVRREAVRTLSRFVANPGCLEECEEMIIAALEDDDGAALDVLASVVGLGVTEDTVLLELEGANVALLVTGAVAPVSSDDAAVLPKLSSPEVSCGLPLVSSDTAP